MGNRCNYNLEIRDNSDSPLGVLIASNIIDELRDTSYRASEAIDSDGGSMANTTWDDVDDDLKKFSTSYPNYLFVMHEDWNDGHFAYTYYKDGKMQQCPGKIVYPEYDPALLK
jgi:hypothetical protein